MGLGRGPIGYSLTYWLSVLSMSSVTGERSVGPVEGGLRDTSKGTEVLSHIVRARQIISQKSLLYWVPEKVCWLCEVDQ
jgi:hypothetical protein